MTDCAICVVAMVTGYPYERVVHDRERYAQQTADGKYYEWWVDYIQHEGWTVQFRPFIEAYGLWKNDGPTAGILGMTIPHLQVRHVAVLDAKGVIDPADGFPDHIHLVDYILQRLPDGVVFDNEFLTVHCGKRSDGPATTDVGRIRPMSGPALLARLRRRLWRRSPRHTIPVSSGFSEA